MKSRSTAIKALTFTSRAMILSISLLGGVSGCALDQQQDGNVLDDESDVDGLIESTWPADEDCKNWGCKESSAAQALIATAPSNGLACTNGSSCASGFCVDGVCCDTACTGTCQACTAAKKGSGADGTCGVIARYGDPDNECPSAACDGAGACKSYNGVTCGDATQCLSGNCVDGYCCGNACDGTCRACSIAKHGGAYNGQCLTIPAGTDPDHECASSSCGGSASCAAAVGLSAGSACGAATQCASGFCVDGVCCDSACTGTCEACSASKKGSGANGTCGAIALNADPDNECAAGHCNGARGCIGLNGAKCDEASECLSGYCVDGVCCGNACTGLCQACSAELKGAGPDGQCGPIGQNEPVVDDEFPTCDTGLGGTCGSGSVVCNGNDGAECVEHSSTEVCDGIDNDCDGDVDDGNPGGGASCFNYSVPTCVNGIETCVGGQITCELITSPEVCDGIDNNCDGNVDEGNPDGGAACTTVQPAPLDAGVMMCNNGSVMCMAFESEPNNVCAEANSLVLVDSPPSALVRGTAVSDIERDVYSFTIPGSDSVIVNINTYVGGTYYCTLPDPNNLSIELFEGDCATLVSGENDDGDPCSSITNVTLPPGTYYVIVGKGTATFPTVEYDLVVTLPW